jgi:uncharacterized protein
MASNRGNQGGGNRGGDSDRGFAGMNDEEQRKIAQKGGEASARSQKRDDQGQFAGSKSGGGSNRSGGSNSGGGSKSGGGSNSGGGGSRGNQGGSNR